jgi:hypothetical protein
VQPTTVAYVGKTTPAAIATPDAAEAIAISVLGNTENGPATLAASTQAPARAANPLPGLVAVLNSTANLTVPARNVAAGATTTIQGPCGGTETISATGTSTATSYSAAGVVTFTGFCSVGADGTQVVANGSVAVTMSGTSDYDYQMQLHADRLQLVAGGATYYYTLDYSVVVSGGYEGTATMNAVFQAPSGKTYRIDNYQVTVGASGSSLYVQGRFYDPDNGYVDVTTPVLITYGSCGAKGNLPLTGTLEVTGANGVYADFAPLDCTSYRVCVTGVATVCQTYLW